jgi:glutamine amidotransferase
MIESVSTIQMGIAVTDGQSIWAFRYASAARGAPVSLFYSTDIETLRELYPDTLLFRRLDEEARLVVSEPLSDLPGAWQEVPPGSWGVVQPGADELHEFRVAS